MTAPIAEATVRPWAASRCVAALEPVGPHIREQDGGAGVCEAVGAGESEPLRGTGHEGAPAVEADELGDRAPVFHRKAL